MNWYRDEYDYHPPWDYGRRHRPDYVPVPPGVDPLKIMEFMDRVQRRSAKSKDDKKKDEKKPFSHGEAFLKYAQWVGLLYFTAPLAILLNHWINQLIVDAMK